MDRLMDGQNGGQINDPITDGPSKKKKKWTLQKKRVAINKGKDKKETLMLWPARMCALSLLPGTWLLRSNLKQALIGNKGKQIINQYGVI